MTFDDWWYDIDALTGWKCSHEAALEVWNASAAAEREACAKVCDAKAAEFQKCSEQHDCQEDQDYRSRKWGSEECAVAVRERSNAEVSR